ncbi:MAG: methyltransferase type 11 [Verrucomicrobia bacterium GWC2_42_7]|nr:MAG: methyltransferase type 11 [Verrucomicrobia bacterium GWC2_42_7]
MINRNHSNRRAHNWLIYDICDKFLQKYTPYYKGILYDLGCGESPFRDFFLSYADKYVGVDWSESYHKTKADIITDLNFPLPVESEVADTIVSLSVMEHLFDPQMMLNEAFRILKPEGMIILHIPWQWWIHEEPYDFYRYSPFGLNHLFAKAGFVEIVVEPQAGFFTTAILKWNYFTNRFVRGSKELRWVIKTCMTPFWYLGQKLAPPLDKLDRNWALETSGYFVTARKPTRQH